MQGIAQDRIVDLEAKVQHLEARLEGLTGIVAAMRPVAKLLSSYGVSPNQERVIYRIVDEMALRLENGEQVSFAEFEERVLYLVGQLRGERRFIGLLVEALRIEHPALKRLYDQFTNAMALFRH
jgi:hypothetical protein